MAGVIRPDEPFPAGKRRWLPLVLAGVVVVAAALTVAFTRFDSSGGGESGGANVPIEFRHACGHPGEHVIARHVPVTIRHAACDLTGVGISTADRPGAYVPRSQHWGVEIANSSGFHLKVDDNGNVTVWLQGPPGNM